MPTLEQMRNAPRRAAGACCCSRTASRSSKDAKVFLSHREDVQEGRLHVRDPPDRPDARDARPVRARDPADADRDREAAGAPRRRAGRHVGARRRREQHAARRRASCSRRCARSACSSVLTLVSAFVLGQVVEPALEALLVYFSLAVNVPAVRRGRVVGPRVRGAVRRDPVPRAQPRDADPLDDVLPRQVPEDLPGAVQRRHADRHATRGSSSGASRRCCSSSSSRGCSCSSRRRCSMQINARPARGHGGRRGRVVEEADARRPAVPRRRATWCCSGPRAASRRSSSSRPTR